MRIVSMICSFLCLSACSEISGENYDLKQVVLMKMILVICMILCASDSIAANIKFTRDEISVVITIDGEIESGDFDKFQAVALWAFLESTAEFEWNMMSMKQNNPERYEDIKSRYGEVGGAISLTVLLNSGGGDLYEAMQIGDSIRKMVLKTETSNLENMHSSCMSACFFIWLAGIEREASYISKNPSIGIHRLYFSPEQYKDLSSTAAEEKYSEAQEAAEKYLLDMGAPEQLINKLFAIPSNEVYFLSDSEIDSLVGVVPYYDELLISRCGSGTAQEETDYIECKFMYPAITDGSSKNLSSAEKNYLSNKCQTLSPGYLKYLETTYLETNICQNRHDEIERWKRMDIYNWPKRELSAEDFLKKYEPEKKDQNRQ